MLTYHQATIDLSGLPLEAPSEGLASVEEREQSLGIRFPAAVRERYALNPPPDLLGMGDNQDRPMDGRPSLTGLTAMSSRFVSLMPRQAVDDWAYSLGS